MRRVGELRDAGSRKAKGLPHIRRHSRSNSDRCRSGLLSMNSSCLFCKIVSRDLAARLVFEDEISLAFLDHRPVFPGHSLLIPKAHHETLADLPANLIGPFLSRAVESAMEAHGTFVAMNNRVSQSVPHLHVHIVPRRRKDGLKGFFWPRYPYENEEQAGATQAAIKAAMIKLSP